MFCAMTFLARLSIRIEWSLAERIQSYKGPVKMCDVVASLCFLDNQITTEKSNRNESMAHVEIYVLECS